MICRTLQKLKNIEIYEAKSHDQIETNERLTKENVEKENEK